MNHDQNDEGPQAMAAGRNIFADPLMQTVAEELGRATVQLIYARGTNEALARERNAWAVRARQAEDAHRGLVDAHQDAVYQLAATRGQLDVTMTERDGLRHELEKRKRGFTADAVKGAPLRNPTAGRRKA